MQLKKQNQITDPAARQPEAFIRRVINQAGFILSAVSRRVQHGFQKYRFRPLKQKLSVLLASSARTLPSIAVILVLATLVTYLIIEPVADRPDPEQKAADPQPAVQTDQRQVALHADVPDFADYPEINRGGYPDGAGLADRPPAGVLAPTAIADPAEPPEPTATPDPTPIPTATPTPLEVDSDGIVQEPVAIADFTGDDTRIYIKAFEANVRISPRTDADILLTLTMGDRLTRTGLGDFWSQVLTESGQAGYIYNTLLSETVIYKPKPSATPTPRPTSGPKPTATPKPTVSANPTSPSDSSSGLSAAQKQEIVDLAKSFLGVRYVYGGSSPSGFDCSGLTSYIYKTLFNVTLPRRAKDQAYFGTRVSSSAIQIGDIICFDWSSPRGECDHVGIYIGGGQYIHASYTAGKVKQSTVNFSSQPILSVRRVIP